MANPASCPVALALRPPHNPQRSLLSLLKSRAQGAWPLSTDQRVTVALHLARGMAHLHSKNFIHRDVAARNVLVSEDFTFKISDFGLGREMTPAANAETTENDEEMYYRSATQNPLPVRWTSPEGLLSNKFTSASDVWAWGVVVYEVFADGEKPYAGMTNLQVMRHVTGLQPAGAADPVTPSLAQSLGYGKHNPAGGTDTPNLAQSHGYGKPNPAGGTDTPNLAQSHSYGQAIPAGAADPGTPNLAQSHGYGQPVPAGESTGEASEATPVATTVVNIWDRDYTGALEPGGASTSASASTDPEGYTVPGALQVPSAADAQLGGSTAPEAGGACLGRPDAAPVNFWNQVVAPCFAAAPASRPTMSALADQLRKSFTGGEIKARSFAAGASRSNTYVDDQEYRQYARRGSSTGPDGYTLPTHTITNRAASSGSSTDPDGYILPVVASASTDADGYTVPGTLRGPSAVHAQPQHSSRSRDPSHSHPQLFDDKEYAFPLGPLSNGTVMVRPAGQGAVAVDADYTQQQQGATAPRQSPAGNSRRKIPAALEQGDMVGPMLSDQSENAYALDFDIPTTPPL